jgi:hypothetical protein
MRVTAIDPGDRWVELASMREFISPKLGRRWGLSIAVLDRQGLTMRSTVDIALRGVPTIVIVEEFRARLQGHQAFSKLETPRLIGAIEYAHVKPLAFVPSGDPSEVNRLLGDIPKLWKGGMDAKGFDAGRSLWNHGWSAWRCLAIWLLHQETSLLEQLRDSDRSRFSLSDFTRGPWPLDQQRDLTARSLIWRPR